MKRLLTLLMIGLIVFVVIYRQRIFLWDPIAHVTRDGMQVNGVRTLINYSNDVILQDASAGKQRTYLVQSWSKVAATPSAPLKCIQLLACMTDADQATVETVPAGSRGRRSAFEGVTMTNRRVEFVDEDGALVEVVLR